jgi:AcrR family transcriptional regulator
MEGSRADAPGLRDRHKARTRLAISDVATQLFVEHGFERVTVAQIAEAADVSVKTVFNYFPSKEDLFFDRADELCDVLVDAVVQRPPGTTVVGALHALLADRRVPFDESGWKSLRDPEGYEHFRSFIAAEHEAPALRARRLVVVQRWMERLAETFVHELEVDELRARTLAAMVVAAMGLREGELSAAMLERAPARHVERRVRAVVDEAFTRLARAFADVDPA